MQKKTLLISGGTGFVGLPIARRFAKDGYRVFLLSRSGAKEESFAHEGFEIETCDLADDTGLESIFDSIIAKAGTIDVCIHAASTKFERKNLTALNSAAFRAQFEVEVFGGFSLLSAVSRHMRTQGHGSIIGILSTAAESTTVTSKTGAYVPAKLALREYCAN